MIPHHENAVQMSKLILKHATQEELDEVGDFEDILHGIINVQNFQIHQFRNYLNAQSDLMEDSWKSDVIPPTLEGMKMKDDKSDDKKDDKKDSMKSLAPTLSIGTWAVSVLVSISVMFLVA